jgi:hypothetical protein
MTSCWSRKVRNPPFLLFSTEVWFDILDLCWIWYFRPVLDLTFSTDIGFDIFRPIFDVTDRVWEIGRNSSLSPKVSVRYLDPNFKSSRVYNGDQMSLWKNSPKCNPTHFLGQNLIHWLYLGKNRSKNLRCFCYLKNCQKKTAAQWAKMRPISSPNVTVRFVLFSKIVVFDFIFKNVDWWNADSGRIAGFTIRHWSSKIIEFT